MKKNFNKKLSLKKQTISNLGGGQMGLVKGGNIPDSDPCADTRICPTSVGIVCEITCPACPTTHGIVCQVTCGDTCGCTESDCMTACGSWPCC